MTLPNFPIVGAAKAGTPSLHHYLDQFPTVFVSPIKEPHFFAIEGGRASFGPASAEAGMHRKSVADPKEYEALFDGVRGEKAIGEASTSYLYSPKAPGRVEDLLPGANSSPYCVTRRSVPTRPLWPSGWAAGHLCGTSRGLWRRRRDA